MAQLLFGDAFQPAVWYPTRDEMDELKRELFQKAGTEDDGATGDHTKEQ